MVKTSREKDGRICSYENMENGSEWTPEDSKAKTLMTLCLFLAGISRISRSISLLSYKTGDGEKRSPIP